MHGLPFQSWHRSSSIYKTRSGLQVDRVCNSPSLSLFIEGVKGVSSGINSDYLGTSKRMRKVRAIVRFTIEFYLLAFVSRARTFMYDGRTQMQCATIYANMHVQSGKKNCSLRCILLVTKLKGTKGRSLIIPLKNGRKVSFNTAEACALTATLSFNILGCNVY